MREATATVFAPAEQIFGSMGRALAQTMRRIGGQDDQVAALRRENAELREQALASQVDARVAQELQQLLGTADRGRYRVLPARVIAFGPAQGFARTVAIDLGHRAGVRSDMTVVNGDGLVGRVVEVSADSATVLLAVDPGSTVGVRIADTAEMGVLTGAGDGRPTLRLLDPQAAVQPGDDVVTLGSPRAQPFAAGIPIGEIQQVRAGASRPTPVATVQPHVDFTALDVVGVVVEPSTAATHAAPRRSPRPITRKGA
ncbi:rod shape-determining protein MreC [Jiangella rhizosphaerae]|nr:rod shape-determining protein MreC [Jiangella rhizosphaerae]